MFIFIHWLIHFFLNLSLGERMSTRGYLEILWFSSSNCMVSIFSFKSLIQLEFILVYDVGDGSNLIFLQMVTQVAPHHLSVHSGFPQWSEAAPWSHSTLYIAGSDSHIITLFCWGICVYAVTPGLITGDRLHVLFNSFLFQNVYGHF